MKVSKQGSRMKEILGHGRGLMRSLAAALALVVLTVGEASAQTNTAVDSVNVHQSQSPLSVVPFGMPYGVDCAGGPAPPDTLPNGWRKWQAYEDTRKISESDFFSKAGYAKEAHAAESHHSGAIGMYVVGILCEVAATVCEVAANTRTETVTTGYFTYERIAPDNNLLGIGLVLDVAGAVFCYSGAKSASESRATYARAQATAEGYNKRMLEISIKREF